MSAPMLRQKSVILTPRVTTLKGPTPVDAWMDIRATVKIAQVSIHLILFSRFDGYFRVQSHYSFILLAIVTGCSPSCGPSAICQEIDGRSVCACNPGFQGNGYNCAG